MFKKCDAACTLSGHRDHRLSKCGDQISHAGSIDVTTNSFAVLNFCIVDFNINGLETTQLCLTQPYTEINDWPRIKFP